VQQALAVLAPALHPVPAEGVHRLRGQPQVRHHRDSGLHQFLHLVHHPLAAFELDRVRPGFLQEPDRGGQGLARRDLVGAERQVRDDHRPPGAADHGGGERDQVVHRHRNGAVVAEDDHPGRVADEQHQYPASSKTRAVSASYAVSIGHFHRGPWRRQVGR
jgi:hypothetical protein